MNIGDVVSLRSGSPPMTITRVVTGGEAYECVYWNSVTGRIEIKEIWITALRPGATQPTNPAGIVR